MKGRGARSPSTEEKGDERTFAGFPELPGPAGRRPAPPGRGRHRPPLRDAGGPSAGARAQRGQVSLNRASETAFVQGRRHGESAHSALSVDLDPSGTTRARMTGQRRDEMNDYSTVRNTSFATVLVAALAGLVSNG